MVDAELEPVANGSLEIGLTFSGHGFAVGRGVVPALNEPHSAAGDDGHL